jgi:mono/diheme cytochrome c family protein
MKRTPISRWLFLGLVSIAILSWPAAAAAQEGDDGPATPPFPQAGAPIYQVRCANCHGPTGKGDGAQAVQAGLEMPDLTDPAQVWETTPARWYEIISNGVAGKAMPPFGDASNNPLREAERWDLVFYLYTLSTSPGQVAMGQALYEGSCLACHEVDGTGSAEVVSDFTDLAEMATRSQADLVAALSDTTIEGHALGLGEVEDFAVTNYVRTFSYNCAPPSETNVAAATTPFTDGVGVVSGQVINGTAGSAPPEGLEVSLRAFDMNADFVDAITTTVGADGSFRFEGIDPTVPLQLEPLAVYQGVPYFGNLDAAIILSTEQPEASVSITVYETTEEAKAIRVERLHIVFDAAPGQIQVAELYILSNDSDRTYVGTLEEGTLRLSVPANALDFQPGGDPNRYRTLADGVADTVPIPPGESTAESVLIYELAYGSELELTRPMQYKVNTVNIFVPADAGIQVSGNGIRPGGPFDAQGTTLETYLAEDLPAGEALTLRLSGEPQASSAAAVPSPHRRPGPSETQSIAIGAVTMVGALTLAYLYWQGRLTLRRRRAGQDRESALLQAIAELDDGFEAGGMKETPYRTRRAELKEELIALMEGEG